MFMSWLFDGIGISLADTKGWRSSVPMLNLGDFRRNHDCDMAGCGSGVDALPRLRGPTYSMQHRM